MKAVMIEPKYAECSGGPKPEYDYLIDEANQAGFHSNPPERNKVWYDMIDCTQHGIVTLEFNEHTHPANKRELSRFAFDIINSCVHPKSETQAINVAAWIFSLIFLPDREVFENN